MKKNFLCLILIILILTSCTGKKEKLKKGLDNEENLNILTNINDLAIDTFIAKAKDNPVSNDNLKTDLSTNYKSDNKSELILNIKKEINNNPKAKWVYDNFYKINDVDAYLSGNDLDTIEFVYNMNNNITKFPYSEGESLKLNRKTPMYLQWDNRWAYNKLGDRNIGVNGCGPTSMAMILSRLKDDPSITPDKVAEDAKTYMVAEGISWNFFNDYKNKYNYNIENVNLDENLMKKALEKGPLLVSVKKGYFTLYGHLFVIDSYKDGKFLINDPNSIKNSKREWSFDEIKDQIIHIWSIY
ncbi:C39 family peptidase [Anaerococcus sp. Marseille-P3625]|uniref:C39 family peptidase n=1 Tax=Anaerococcus sp. Marseille-P3625 TaxID=1977277 RepID=UPI000C076753|nr:C39 family peptidase [Anaerococcus sp. Marseille-P3625]